MALEFEPGEKLWVFDPHPVRAAAARPADAWRKCRREIFHDS